MGRYKTENPQVHYPIGVTAGTYTNANVTINSQGVVTFATNGIIPATDLNALTDVTISALLSN